MPALFNWYIYPQTIYPQMHVHGNVHYHVHYHQKFILDNVKYVRNMYIE